jgi:hypothetical protein
MILSNAAMRIACTRAVAMKSRLEAWHVVRLHGRRIIGIGKMPLLTPNKYSSKARARAVLSAAALRPRLARGATALAQWLRARVIGGTRPKY